MSERPKRSLGPRFSLRTLLVAMLLLGPLGAVGWKEWLRWREWDAQRAARLDLQRAQAANKAYYARAMAALNNLNSGALPVDEDESPRSDESFPESDPR